MPAPKAPTVMTVEGAAAAAEAAVDAAKQPSACRSRL